MTTTDKLWLTIAILTCIIFVQSVTYSPPSVAGGTVPPCATATRRPTRTPQTEATPNTTSGPTRTPSTEIMPTETATPTPTIIGPAYLGYDWLPLVGGGKQ